MQTFDVKDLYDEIDGFDPDEATNVEKLQLVKMLLQTAVGLMADVAKATSDTHAETYLVDHLKIMAGSDHGFMSRDFNIDEWIEQVEAAEAEEDDSEK